MESIKFFKEIKYTEVNDKQQGVRHRFFFATNYDTELTGEVTEGILEMCDFGSECNSFFYGGVDKLPETIEEFQEMIDIADYSTSYTNMVTIEGIAIDEIAEYISW